MVRLSIIAGLAVIVLIGLVLAVVLLWGRRSGDE